MLWSKCGGSQARIDRVPPRFGVWGVWASAPAGAPAMAAAAVVAARNSRRVSMG